MMRVTNTFPRQQNLANNRGFGPFNGEAMDTEFIEPPMASNVKTVDQLKDELSVNIERWSKRKNWEKDEALKLFVGVDPNKFDPKSPVHWFYLKTLNIDSLEAQMQLTTKRPLRKIASKKYWFFRLKKQHRAQYNYLCYPEERN